MWKLALGFIIFAGLALFILSKGGDIDMSGEKHGIDAHPPAASGAGHAATPAPAEASAPVAAPAAPAASK